MQDFFFMTSSNEGESICGWTHDADHDFDFERRSGYNNKTISMVTGPHADHTSGIPFQGHYMVINTNTEVFTKRARLISPLYKISAQTLCLKLYYHMYGVNIGTLRAYLKPESVEMQDVLLEDTESEARNEFVVFEIKGKRNEISSISCSVKHKKRICLQDHREMLGMKAEDL